MLVLQIITIGFLLTIMWQDFSTRTIHWALIASSCILQGTNCYIENGAVESISILFKNLMFLMFQLAILVGYYSFRQRPARSIINTSIGSGDLFFFIIMALSFSFLNFMFFYFLGLVFSLAIWLVFRMLKRINDKYVPLAGMLSAYMIILLILDILFSGFSRFDDSLIMNLLWKLI
jgi:hypothetical protein